MENPPNNENFPGPYTAREAEVLVLNKINPIDR